MSVEQLKRILEKCNDEDMITIEVNKFSSEKEDFVETKYEDITKTFYIHYSDNGETGLVLCTTIYEE